MKKSLRILFFTFLLVQSLYSQTVDKDYIDGRVYVKFNKTALKEIAFEDPNNIQPTKLKSLKPLLSKYAIQKVSKPFYHASDDEHLPCILRIDFQKINDANNLVKELSRLKGVEYAEKVPLSKADLVPNDVMFATASGSTHLNQINAQNAWNVFSGNSNITVAIIDNAVMASHADLAGNIYTNTQEIPNNSIDDDGNGYIDDVNGWDAADDDNNTTPPNISMMHGTHCAGIAGAVTNNNTGVSSIGWGIKIIPVKCEPNTSSNPIFVTYGYEGIVYAVRAKARIISCSWGSAVFSNSEQLVMNYAWNRGSLVFASSGNGSSNTVNYPGTYANVFCVAWVDPNDVKASQSNYGTWVDICAPGTNILSTVPYTGTPDYQPSSGTSMATPMVAGLAGLMLSKSPQMTNTDVLNCLSSTAVNIYTLSGNNAFVAGNMLGAGRIDAFAAMNCAAGYSSLAPIANFYGFPLSVCPGSTVNFNDSSLYLPTSYNWVFQGGTPATSTLQNPAVVYNTAGTYSVSLTVTNANGTSSKTKLSYVKVAGPSPLNLVEGFQGTTFLPTDWSANNIGNDAMYWERATGFGGFGTSTACAAFNNYDNNVAGDRDEMRTPKYDLTNAALVRLRFDVAFARYDAFNSDSLQVKLSTDCGATWTSIYLKGGVALATAPDNTSQFIPTANQWRRDSIDITALAAGHSNVMFSFVNRGFFGQMIYLDNINLAFPNFTLNTNIPSNVCVNTPVVLANTTNSPALYSWTVQGASPATSTATNPTVSFSSPGNYTIGLSGINGINSSIITRSITVLPAVTLSTGTTPTICSGNSVTLNASGATTYSWSNGSSSSSVQVSPLVNSAYTVTGGNGACSDTKTVDVVVTVKPPLSIQVQPGDSICPGQTVTLTAIGSYTSYLWTNPGVSGPSLSATLSGTTIYTVNASGTPGGCVSSKAVTVVARPIPSAALAVSASGCGTVCLGMMSSTVNGGVAPYTYSLSGSGCNTSSCNNLCQGAYTLSTSDAKGCVGNSTFAISPSVNNLSVNVTTINASCSNCADGQLNAGVINGGTSPYSFTWSPNGGNNAVASNLGLGCYTVQISDAMACTISATACVSILTGVETFDKLGTAFKLYPNPANREVTIMVDDSEFNCVVYNSLGQLVFSQKNNKSLLSISIATCSRGIYFVEIEISGHKTGKKLLVE